MSVLDVAKICGPSRVFRADGEKLRRAIEDTWSKGQPAVVDFGGVRIASVSFLDESIAVLALSIPVAQLKAQLEVRNLTEDDRHLLNRLLASRVEERTAAIRTSDLPSEP